MLENAYEYINEFNRPVFVRIQAEPDNQADPNAIAVQLCADEDFETVGYIAKELSFYTLSSMNLKYLLKV